jgi:type IV secretory pathway VirB4 component
MRLTISQLFGSTRKSDPLSRWVPYSCFVSPTAFLTKTGAVGMTLQLRGYDYETKTQEQLEQVSRRMMIANNVFTLNRFRIYHHLLKRSNAKVARQATYKNKTVESLVTERINHLESAGLYEMDLYMTILSEPPAGGISWLGNLLEKNVQRRMNAECSRQLHALEDVVESYRMQMHELLGITVLDKEGCYRHLRLMLNPTEEIATRLKGDDHVDYQAADTEIKTVSGVLQWGDVQAKVFSLKEEPITVIAHLMRDLLRIPGDIQLTYEWRPTDKGAMIRNMNLKRHQVWGQRKSAWQAMMTSDHTDLMKDESSTEFAQDLNQAIKELRNNGNYFCDSSLSVVVFSREAEKLRNLSQRVRQVFSNKGATLLEETDLAKRMFFSRIPGNSLFNIRYRSILNLAVPDLTPCFRPAEGNKRNSHLIDEYLSVFESRDGTLVYFTPHYGEVASGALLGTTGTGKSLLLDQFIDDGQKYPDPFTFIIDVGGSHRIVTKRHGGSYARVKMDDIKFGVNPFRQPHSVQTVNFILEFIRVLLANEGYELKTEQEFALLAEIEAVFCLPEERRRIGRISFPRDMRRALHSWIDNGRFAHFVDCERDDLVLTRFQTWDFTDMREAPKLLGPLIWYTSNWIARIVRNPDYAHCAKACYMDEAWRFGEMKDFIREAAKTWRKHGAWIILSTQDEEDLRSNGLLDVVNANCPTKIFMSNPGVDVARYGATFRLSKRERDLLATMKIGEFLVKTPDDSKLCVYRPSAARIAEYKTQFTTEREFVAL